MNAGRIARRELIRRVEAARDPYLEAFADLAQLRDAGAPRAEIRATQARAWELHKPLEQARRALSDFEASRGRRRPRSRRTANDTGRTRPRA